MYPLPPCHEGHGEKLQDDMSPITPYTTGIWDQRGAEAAIHASRVYLHNLVPDHLLLKLDFKEWFQFHLKRC